MSHTEAGFLLGALPGIAMILRNMWRSRVFQKKVEALAWRDRDWSDTQLSVSQTNALSSKDPQRYIDPDDSLEMVNAKRELIASLAGFKRRHWAGVAITVVGAVTGVILGSVLG